MVRKYYNKDDEEYKNGLINNVSSDTYVCISKLDDNNRIDTITIPNKINKILNHKFYKKSAIDTKSPLSVIFKNTSILILFFYKGSRILWRTLQESNTLVFTQLVSAIKKQMPK